MRLVFGATLSLIFVILLGFVFTSFSIFFVIPEIVNSFAFSFSSPLNILFHAFFHTGYEHLLVNVALLSLAGLVIERRIGFKHFMLLFFGGVAFSALAFSFFNSIDRLVGASGGAVSLLVGSFAIDFKKTFLFGIFFFFVCLLLVQTISYNLFLVKQESRLEIESLKSKVVELERSKDPAVVLVKEKIREKESFVVGIEKTESFQLKTSPDLVVHFAGALFGGIYSYFFLGSFLVRRHVN